MTDTYSRDLVKRSCNLCGGNDFALVSACMRKGPQLATVICKKCSLVFTNPAPSEEIYYSFYTNDYNEYYGGSTASRPQASLEPAIFSIIQRFIKPASSDYLEIGPGRGLTLYHANKLFRNVKGVEPSTDFSNLLVEKYRLDVVNTTFEDFITKSNDKVDVVSMFHVLEHIYDPYKGLMNIRNILREDGLVVIEVPNILKPFRDLDRYFLRFVHLYNFSPFTLRHLLKTCGFDLLYLDDGGDDWSSPQNITVIARKVSIESSAKIEFTDETNNVLMELHRYRTQYLASLRFKWFFFDKTRIPRKYYRKIKYKMGVMLRSFLRLDRSVKTSNHQK